MDNISLQYGRDVSMVQSGKKLEEQAATLLSELAAYTLPLPLENTGLRLRIVSERLMATVLGTTLCAVVGNVIYDRRLAGRIDFVRWVDDKPTGKALFSILLDGHANVALHAEGQPVNWRFNTTHASSKDELFRNVGIALVEAGGTQLDALDA